MGKLERRQSHEEISSSSYRRLFGVSTGASAIDFKAKGQWIMSFDYGQNGNVTGGAVLTGYNGKQDEFEASQRVRLQLGAVASEALSGTVCFEIGI